MRLKKSRYLALEDAIFDSRIPLRSDEEFRVGILFAAKLVGCGNVARPNSRMEIVAAMRRIRTDCRSRKDKKRKVVITVSYEGVRVALPSGKKTNSTIAIAQHPIHRIFYVSHDSLDLHIFSYIAREGSSFKCFVFKAAKQSLAVNVVRTIGQAFELCHRMSLVMNETAVNGSFSTSAVAPTNVHGEVGTACADSGPAAATTEPIPEEGKGECRPDKFDTSRLVTSLSQGFDMDIKMLQNVDSKLDKLANKVELLENQISTLLKHLEIKSGAPSSSEGSSCKSSCNDLKAPSKAMLLNDLKYLDQAQLNVDKMEKSNKLAFLNSPDSLLSSPIMPLPVNNSTNSCLLFNDFY